MLEHAASTEIYKRSHKPHHRFTNPKLFDAFNGTDLAEMLMSAILLALEGYGSRSTAYCYRQRECPYTVAGSCHAHSVASPNPNPKALVAATLNRLLTFPVCPP
jgi:hypothetical protein